MLESLRIIGAIFVRDIKRLVHNPVALIVTLGICILPSLYAWYCIAANWDPYAHTGALKVAVANNDKGANAEYVGHIDVGAEVVAGLENNHELGWQFVDEKTARTGVESGEYYAAIIIPTDFSSAFASVFSGDFTRPQLDYYVNEKLSSVAPKITEQGAATVEKSIDEKFITKVSETLVEITQNAGGETLNAGANAESQLETSIKNASATIGDTRTLIGSTKDALDKAKGMANSAKGELSHLQDAAPGLTSSLNQAQNSLENLRSTIGDYNAQAQTSLTEAAASLQSALDTVKTHVPDVGVTLPEGITPGELIDAAQAIQSSAAQTDRALDAMSMSLGALAGVARAAEPLLAQSSSVMDQLEGVLNGTTGALDSADRSLSTIQTQIDSTLTDIRALQDASSVKELASYLNMPPDEIGQFMAAPVEMKTVTIYPVSNYGSGVTPFYSNLALWVAGFILMAVVRMRVDPEGLPAFTARQAYFGRWLFYLFIGLIQASIVCIGDLLMGIQCENPLAFLGAGLLAEFVYVNLIYALAKAFRHIGKAVAVLLLIMQIPGSSGMYPVEMMPSFYQAIHPLLPFTYSIDAMREAIGGFYGLHYLWDMLALAVIFIPIGFFIGLFVGKHAYNLNLLFDDKLGKTDLFVAENTPAVNESAKFTLSPVLHALLDTSAYREKLIRRARMFSRNYQRMVKAGWVAIFAQPVLTLALMFAIKANVNTKLLLLCLMVVGIIIVNLYLIVITYMNADIKYQLATIGDVAASDTGSTQHKNDISHVHDRSDAITDAENTCAKATEQEDDA